VRLNRRFRSFFCSTCRGRRLKARIRIAGTDAALESCGIYEVECFEAKMAAHHRLQ
jgi:hypothetical protein